MLTTDSNTYQQQRRIWEGNSNTTPASKTPAYGTSHTTKHTSPETKSTLIQDTQTKHI